MKKTVEANKYRMDFEDFDDFIRQCQEPPHGSHDQRSSINTYFSYKDIQTHSYEEAVKLARDGWPEGLAKMQAFRDKVASVQGTMAERPEHVYREAGDEPDVARYLSGEPENMIEYENAVVPSAGRVARIVVNCCVSAGVTGDAIFYKGAAAVLLADAIESMGMRSEIVLACGIGRQGQGHAEFRCVVKRPDQPLELDRLAFMLAHPSVLRRFIFRLEEQSDHDEYFRFFSYGYGRVTDVECAAEDIYVEPMQWGFGNQINCDEDAVKLINRMLAKYFEGSPDILEQIKSSE